MGGEPDRHFTKDLKTLACGQAEGQTTLAPDRVTCETCRQFLESVAPEHVRAWLVAMEKDGAPAGRLDQAKRDWAPLLPG